MGLPRKRKRKPSYSPPDGAPLPPAPAGHLISGQRIDADKRAFVRELRGAMTPAETALWARLRGNKLNGLHFRRQQIVHGFIADLYCHAAGVVVEVDGGVHATQADYDQARDLAFAALGLIVLRVRNEDVAARLPNVLERISTACAARLAEKY